MKDIVQDQSGQKQNQVRTKVTIWFLLKISYVTQIQFLCFLFYFILFFYDIYGKIYREETKEWDLKSLTSKSEDLRETFVKWQPNQETSTRRNGQRQRTLIFNKYSWLFKNIFASGLSDGILSATERVDRKNRCHRSFKGSCEVLRITSLPGPNRYISACRSMSYTRIYSFYNPAERKL